MNHEVSLAVIDWAGEVLDGCCDSGHDSEGTISRKGH